MRRLSLLYWKFVILVLRKIIFALPLKVDRNKIVFNSFYTRGYSDSPKAIVNEIIRQKLDYKLICIVDDMDILPSGITGVKARSVAALFHMRTAGVWVDNCRKPPYVRKQKGQFYLQTWHGCALKRVEKDVVESLDKRYVKMAIRDAKMCDVMISDSKFMTGIYRQSFWFDGEIITCGLPRDDVVIHPDTINRDAIKHRVGIADGKKVAMYAPTFRRDMGLGSYDLKYDTIANSLQKSLGGEWVVLIRLHPNIANKSEAIEDKNVIDVSSYGDAQELLLITDALITDYSSIMFDFMHTGRPGFLYASDIDEYREDRSFYYDIDQLPYTLATSNNELLDNIERFNPPTHRKKINSFFDDIGAVKGGHASAIVVERIKQWMEQAK